MSIYRLPKHAIPFLGSVAGVPWDQSVRDEGLNHYIGIVENSAQWFDTRGMRVLMYESKMDVCADGSGGDRSGGKDTFIADTALHHSSGIALNPYVVPYGVIPLKRPGFRGLMTHGVGLGDLGIAFWRGEMCAFVYGDLGPQKKIGEGSVALCKALGIDPSPTEGGHQAWRDWKHGMDRKLQHYTKPPGIVTVAFPGSRDRLDKRTSRTLNAIQADALTLLGKFRKAR